MTFPEAIRIEIITLSDRASRGEYEDLSGPEIARLCNDYYVQQGCKFKINRTLIPDDPDQLMNLIKKMSAAGTEILFTTGGTGIGMKDFTPDVVGKLLDKEIPGIMEMIRVKYGMSKPNALLSRSIAGVIGSSLIYALPGSLKAVREYCEEILPTTIHSLKMLHGIDDHS